MIQILALLLTLMVGDAFPSGSMTSWMEPAAFRFEIGMPRAEVEKAIKEAGWESAPGKYPRQLVLFYSEKKTVTLGFVEDHLQSVRFEFVDFIPAVNQAFEESRERLNQAKGYEAEDKGAGVFLFDREMPNVMIVVSTKPDTSFGIQGLGFLSVRYYDPSAEQLIP